MPLPGHGDMPQRIPFGATVTSTVFELDLRAALSSNPKRISPKYFYDVLGSKLFEAICKTPEYYLTRTEMSIYARHAKAIALRAGVGRLLAELGSGAGDKVKQLLPYMRPSGYAAIDISLSALTSATDSLHHEFPDLKIIPLHQDFSLGVRLPENLSQTDKIVWYFPGSSIGNWQPLQAQRFLQSLALPGAQLLIGVDLVKPLEVMNAAYNDALGVTAAFNLNLLCRANRELGTDFDLSQFRHVAFYNAVDRRIEMHLESCCNQTVTLNKERFEFFAGERLHTEDSYKYTTDSFAELCAGAGWQRKDLWLDERKWFAVMLFVA